MAHDDSQLWSRSLSDSGAFSRHTHALERLRVSYHSIRQRAVTVAAEINRDLPEFTVHDAAHLDALWHLADEIAGDDYSLNPLEAYVFGAAVLTHDLGLGLAAYPEGVEEIRSEPRWSDAVALVLRSRLGRTPTSREITSPDAGTERQAIQYVLRALHAKHAERLATISWRSNEGEALHLIEDSGLRESLGWVIGRVAHSHWWPPSELQAAFEEGIGAPAGFPRDWTTDVLKVAILLRLADAAHLDAGRAPTLLRAIRRPRGASDDHWYFQNHLHQPRRVQDRLTYTATSPFPIDKASAWWTGFDLLRVLDKELRAADGLMSDLGRPRVAARRVSGVGDPIRLSRLIPTDGWIPVGTAMKVSNVANLVVRLGGDQLYGRDDSVPLRELVQNASDSIRARRVLEQRDAGWGRVTVCEGRDDKGAWIEVSDSGIGMSTKVMSEVLLDFGFSLWEDARLSEELPGLAGQGFTSIGRFGVGFFAVFMWGDRVKVTSRRFDAGMNDTHVLEIESGLESRPLIRSARPDERIVDGGTRVRVWLRRRIDVGRRIAMARNDIVTMERVCAHLVPAPQTDLIVESSGAAGPRDTSLAAHDWVSMSGMELLRRTGTRLIGHAPPAGAVERIAGNLRPLYDQDGEVIGRAAISPMLDDDMAPAAPGVIAVGGFRAQSLRHHAGVFLGAPANTARSLGVAIAAPEELARWATEQAELLRNLRSSWREALVSADIVLACGGNPGDAPIAACSRGLMTRDGVRTWMRGREACIVTTCAHVATKSGYLQWSPHDLRDDVLVVAPSGMRQNEVYLDRGPAPLYFASFVEDEIARLAAETWDADVKDVSMAATRRSGSSSETIIEGSGGRPPVAIGQYFLLSAKRTRANAAKQGCMLVVRLFIVCS
jgi:hypothetical protein